jgi:hypothetical protein
MDEGIICEQLWSYTLKTMKWLGITALRKNS